MYLKRNPANNFVGFWLIVLYLLGIYTNVHFYSGGQLLVPVFVSGIAALLLFIKNYKRIRIQQVIAISLIVIVAWLSVLFKGVDGFLVERVKGAAQLTYSILLAYSFFLELSKWEKEKLAKLFYYSSLLIIIGCALENYTPLKIISDNFRHAVFHSSIYEALDRDISFFGRARPKLFTLEPSYVSRFLLYSMVLWVAFSKKNGRLYINIIAFFFAAIFVTGNPNLILIFPIILVITVYLEGSGLSRFLKRMTVNKLLLNLFSLILMLSILTVTLLTVLSARLTIMSEGGAVGGSSIARLVAPPLITLDVLKDYPMWGAGIAGKEMIAEKAFNRLSGHFNLSYVVDANQAKNMVANAFWLHWIYLGLLGGGAMIWAIYRLMKILGARHYLYCFLLMIVLGQTMGAYVSPLSWMVIFGVILTSVVAKRERYSYSHG